MTVTIEQYYKIITIKNDASRAINYARREMPQFGVSLRVIDNCKGVIYGCNSFFVEAAVIISSLGSNVMKLSTAYLTNFVNKLQCFSVARFSSLV